MGDQPADQTPEPNREALRVLADLPRWRVYALLKTFGPLTGRQIAVRVNASEATTLRDLRRLDDIGFVTADDPSTPVRQRLWRAVPGGVQLGKFDRTEEYAEAATAWMRVATAYQFEMVQDWITELSGLPDGWLAASESSDYVLHLTLEELDQLSAEIHDVVDRWKPGRREPRDGTRPVFVTTHAVPYAPSTVDDER